VHNANTTRRLLGGDTYIININGGVHADQHSKRRLAQEIAFEISKLRANAVALPVN
jgi:hypothetical protein